MDESQLIFSFPGVGWKVEAQYQTLADLRAAEARAYCVSMRCQKFAVADVQFVSHGCPTDGRAWALCQDCLDDVWGESMLCLTCKQQHRTHYLDVAKVTER